MSDLYRDPHGIYRDARTGMPANLSERVVKLIQADMAGRRTHYRRRVLGIIAAAAGAAVLLALNALKFFG